MIGYNKIKQYNENYLEINNCVFKNTANLQLIELKKIAINQIQNNLILFIFLKNTIDDATLSSSIFYRTTTFMDQSKRKELKVNIVYFNVIITKFGC